MPETRKNWSLVAWNHIRFHCPKSWQPLEIGLRYLVLEDRDGPVMEVKWGPVKGRFSHKTQLDKLASFHKRKLAKTLEPCELPSRWEQKLNGFEVSGFAWQGDESGAKGALIYCPKCRTATIIQFFKEGKVPSQVLDSFQDHREDGLIRWAMFDIQALLPTEFQLTSHSFLAGKFSLSFKGDSHAVHLYRYSPASIILASQDLEGFAMATFPGLGNEPEFLQHMGHDAVEFVREPRAGFSGIIQKLNPKPTHSSARLWHQEKDNRIMAVILEGRTPYYGLLEQVCLNYEIV